MTTPPEEPMPAPQVLPAALMDEPPPATRYVGRAPVVSRRRVSWGRLAMVFSLVLMVVTTGLGLLGYLWLRGVDQGLKRTDAFAGPGPRPVKQVEATRNILLLGSDSRDPDAPTDGPGKWRTDTTVLMHVPSSGDRAYLVSFPRDLWLYVPRSRDGRSGGTEAKLNAAYAWGGVPLTVATLERYTGVRIDHVVVIDFAGFVRVTDALGGVDLSIERTITSIHKPYRTFTKGRHHLSGAQALDYIRQRKQFPDGDFARMRHQQEFLKAIMDRAASRATLTNPAAFTSFVVAVAEAVTVDPGFSLIELGWRLRGLRGQNLVFLTSPHRGTATIAGQSVVLADAPKAKLLFDAMVNDAMDTWQHRYAPSQTPGA